ncbi:MAG: hypothetical protein PQJ61_10235 [Spirochaetales bacterium]|uniref:Uncharacterized protein n=1 Tax=Candidatus Thalassospirochaeta sargassi TaxID=3119039 RepID=A0AAJ1ID59_9SPIO|nr:hypothetical protein [Spirochaetales bacterium]
MKSYRNKPIISRKFLDEYSKLLTNLKTVFSGGKITPCCRYSTVAYHVERMKNFIIEYGGIRAVEKLAEYEKYSSIGDFQSCKQLETRIIEELELFKNCWLSMLS